MRMDIWASSRAVVCLMSVILFGGCREDAEDVSGRDAGHVTDATVPDASASDSGTFEPDAAQQGWSTVHVGCSGGSWQYHIIASSPESSRVTCCTDQSCPDSVRFVIDRGAVVGQLPRRYVVPTEARAWYDDIVEVQDGEIELDEVSSNLFDESLGTGEVAGGRGRYRVQLPSGEWREGAFETFACAPWSGQGGMGPPCAVPEEER
jgi:hypothetical protein